MPNRRVQWCFVAALLVTAWPVLEAQERTRPAAPLDQLFTVYAKGDRDVIARALRRSLDFQPLRLTDRRRLEQWLGPWDRTRAVFVLDLASHASHVAPAYTIPLLTAGRQYIFRGPIAGDPTPAARTFERLWHQAAIGMLQRYHLSTEIDAYVDAVVRSRPALDPELRARLTFAGAVALEQRCWNERPALARSGTPIRDTNLAPRRPESKRAVPARATPADEVSRRLSCLSETASRFEAASTSEWLGAEARLRLAWARFQLGNHAEAQQALETLAGVTDRDLQYLARLFHGRILSAENRHEEAERAYRSALEIYPDAQSAGVGVALALAEMHRTEDAHAAALQVRGRAERAVDPWWTYLAADSRFIDRWLAELRLSLR